MPDRGRLAVLVALLTALLTQGVHQVGKVPEDASMGVVFTTLFALGVILLTLAAGRVQQRGDQVDLDPDCVLYGRIEFVPLETVAVAGFEVPRALLPLYGADVGLADMSGVLQGVKAQGEAALKSFKAAAAAAGVSAEGRLMQGVSEEFPHDFASLARQVDLTVLGQPRDGDPLIGQYALVERCLFASGRPVMIVPAAPAKVALGTIAFIFDIEQ